MTKNSKVPKSFDAKDWSEEFNDMLVRNGNQPYDPEHLTSWFANALMRGYDEGISAYVKSNREYYEKVLSAVKGLKEMYFREQIVNCDPFDYVIKMLEENDAPSCG